MSESLSEYVKEYNLLKIAVFSLLNVAQDKSKTAYIAQRLRIGKDRMMMMIVFIR